MFVNKFLTIRFDLGIYNILYLCNDWNQLTMLPLRAHKIRLVKVTKSN